MRRINVAAYEASGGRYVMGIYNGISHEKFSFVEACVIRKNELPNGKSLEDGLEEMYLKDPNKGTRVIPMVDILSPQPHRFTFNVK